MSHHMQKKRKIIIGFIEGKIRKSGIKNKEHINERALCNAVIYEYGASREKAEELVAFVLEVIKIG